MSFLLLICLLSLCFVDPAIEPGSVVGKLSLSYSGKGRAAQEVSEIIKVPDHKGPDYAKKLVLFIAEP